ncbi:MAG TPA: Gfo/Idh/MocA family oxidoreductase [Gammaproteobacteria bacterium]|nr:Gfo/Idh/MocA family oxidoreductase [Gammaproteobacteria bacterium]
MANHKSPYADLNIAVIGCGNWGKNHIRVLDELGALYAVSDADVWTAAHFSNEYGVPKYTLDKIIADQKIHGVVIATPAATHQEIAIRCLQAGKHVFVEKPIALTVAEAKKIHEQAKLSRRILMVGHLLHYHAAFQKLKELHAEGHLGQLQYIYSNRLNLGKFRTEENIWWSFAPHDVSMILALVGEMPNTIMAMGANYLMHTVADVTCTHLTFPKGEQAHIFVSWLHPYKEQKLVVVGEKAMAIFDDGQPWKSKLKLHPYPVEWVDGLPKPSQSDATLIDIPKSEPLKEEAKHFLDCILHNKTPITDGNESIRVLTVLNAAEYSIEKYQPVYLAEAHNKFQGELANNYFSHETTCIDPGSHIGSETKIWHFSHILPGTEIGKKCSIGQNCCIGPNVRVGNNCKIQNNVSLYEGVVIQDDVFVGPSVVFTNVNAPRAFINRKREFSPTLVKKGATIGANATILCGLTLGEYCFIAAGAVVTKDVQPFALMAGNPARHIGWVSQDGEPLDEHLCCPRSGRQYRLINEKLYEAS